MHAREDEGAVETKDAHVADEVGRLFPRRLAELGRLVVMREDVPLRELVANHGGEHGEHHGGDEAFGHVPADREEERDQEDQLNGSTETSWKTTYEVDFEHRP